MPIQGDVVLTDVCELYPETDRAAAEQQVADRADLWAPRVERVSRGLSDLGGPGIGGSPSFPGLFLTAPDTLRAQLRELESTRLVTTCARLRPAREQAPTPSPFAMHMRLD